MDLQEHLRRLFAYDDWANREVLSMLRATTNPPARPLQLMAHIVAAEHLWLERLKQQNQSLAVWPSLTLEQCETHVAGLAQAWREYLSALSANGLVERVPYKNSKGESFSSSVQDILTHVVMHSAYHLGQIATAMRGEGHTAAYTDFIHAVRQGLIE